VFGESYSTTEVKIVRGIELYLNQFEMWRLTKYLEFLCKMVISVSRFCRDCARFCCTCADGFVLFSRVFGFDVGGIYQSVFETLNIVVCTVVNKELSY